MQKSITLTLSILLFFTLSANSQLKKVKGAQLPAILPEAFAQKYVKIKPFAWYYDQQANIYVAHFNKKTTEYEAYYTPDGHWLSVETIIDKMIIPTSIQEEFNKSEYKTWNVIEIRRVESDEIKDGCKYKVQKGKDACYLFYDMDGKLLKKEKS